MPRFVDFAIRAWLEGQFLQVIAHSTPAGGMRQPVAVKLGPFNPDDYRLESGARLVRCAAIGRALARFLLPDPIWRMLGESIRVISADSDVALRLRLCLDEALIDLPWELLYRPDVDAPAAHSGFLLMDGRVSLVREPPSILASRTADDRTQRGLFVGALFDDGRDIWHVRKEHRQLRERMSDVSSLLRLDFVRADEAAKIERALDAGCDLFHYAGHVEIEHGRGVVVQRARTEEPAYVESLADRAEWAWSDKLAVKLARAKTRLAVFNACNSGFWPFIRPFMRASIPAVIGVQGEVSNVAALNFAAKLYESLALGLSLDEATTHARLFLLTPGRAFYDASDWARFMVYMPAESAVLFPRTNAKPIRAGQKRVREERVKTLNDARAVVKELDGAGVSRMLTDIAERTVLILGRFTEERKGVLDALKRALTTPARDYIPILFDFEKPADRDLIESILRFASNSRFVIADLSDPKSVPAELQAIVPQFPSLPIIPIIESGQREYPVSDHILRRPSVAKVVRYDDKDHLLQILDPRVLAPAETLYERLKLH